MEKDFSNKIKLCYLLPEFKKNDHTHFAYLGDFLNELNKNFNIYLIVEKIQTPFYDFWPIRFFRMLGNLLYARFCGYKDFYVHYSFFGAFLASLTVKIFGGRAFYWNCGEPWKYKRNIFRESFERTVYKLINFLVTGAESLAKEYSEHYGIPIEKIKIMPNWINLEKIKNQKSKIKINELKNQLQIEPDQKVILFAHRLSRRKGAHYLPEILNGLKDKNVVLIIIGDGPEREALQESIVKCQLSNVRFLGWIPQNEVLRYFAIADVFIMPSDEEGFPHVLLESMATGTPFVASDVGAVRDIIPPLMRNYLVKAGDTEKFSLKIAEIISKKPEESEKIKQLLINWVKRYDIPNITNQFMELMI